jgi:hypothetical protein
LNNSEYNNTIRDLLGDSSEPATGFLAEEAFGFDNIASALGMTPAQYENYFNAASAVAASLLADPARLPSVLTCTPVSADDPCAAQVATDFGTRAFRRPPTEAEIALGVQLYNAEFARSGDAMASAGQMLRGLLASAMFLYRVEVPSNPLDPAPQALTSYEVASRLSYLHWSTMPDPELFSLAATGALLDPATLEAQVDRLLADPKSSDFVRSFGGQWLDISDIGGHSVTPQVFPDFTDELRSAMMTEGYMWFNEFVNGDRLLSEWFTADFNFVDPTLAAHYGMPAQGAAGFTRVETTDDARAGYLGLAHFLTSTSFPGRTSPTLRAVWVLSELLCSEPPQPPPNIPDLDEAAQNDPNIPADSTNVRDRLEAHRADPACQACHDALDPIGLALENFDGIGKYRTTYENGDPIDATGTLPSGVTFNGAQEMSQVLAADPRFAECVSEKLFTYALGRAPEITDTPYLEQIRTDWATRGLTFRNLLKEVVTNDTFRFSRGETL